MENVILTPHNAFAGEFNGRRTFEMLHRDLEQWLKENEQHKEDFHNEKRSP